MSPLVVKAYRIRNFLDNFPRVGLKNNCFQYLIMINLNSEYLTNIHNPRSFTYTKTVTTNFCLFMLYKHFYR